jgi:hypothetical protein
VKGHVATIVASESIGGHSPSLPNSGGLPKTTGDDIEVEEFPIPQR